VGVGGGGGGGVTTIPLAWSVPGFPGDVMACTT
jgi:hypothetical protein